MQKITGMFLKMQRIQFILLIFIFSVHILTL